MNYQSAMALFDHFGIKELTGINDAHLVSS
jgi:hypothetical protein